MIFINKAPVIM